MLLPKPSSNVQQFGDAVFAPDPVRGSGVSIGTRPDLPALPITRAASASTCADSDDYWHAPEPASTTTSEIVRNSQEYEPGSMVKNKTP
jgi:hypothetical protein